MDDLTFGITLTVVGMGGTFLTLWILSLLMNALKKVYPIKQEQDSGSTKG
ncbi:MAG: OadG family protein [Deltaproteobacteria bacterium]|nr:OadG family protein [Deltaproteobacteria bacterium]MBW2138671.1 OadG family protein [Deltaproteobacteria bacterium]